MKENTPIKSPQSIKQAIFQTLLKRIPPKSFSPLLEDVVNILMDALSRGEITINLEDDFYCKEFKNSGWPEAHKEALIASGWISGEASPIILDKSQLSWRRWSE